MAVLVALQVLHPNEFDRLCRRGATDRRERLTAFFSANPDEEVPDPTDLKKVAEEINAENVTYTHYVEFLVSQSEQPKTQSGQPAGFDTTSKWGVVGVAGSEGGVHEYTHEIQNLKEGDEICISAITGYHIIVSERRELVKAAMPVWP
jgi:hypothetical protein